MENGVIFVAGVYGVGKSYLCKVVSDEMDIPFFSAGDLISEYTGEKYGQNKSVTDTGYNQEVLIRIIEEKVKEKDIILAGHMCVFDKKGEISKLDINQLSKLHIKKMILLSANANEIYCNLYKRDNMVYSLDMIKELIWTEREQFIALAELMKYPASIIEMTYSANDAAEMKKILRGEEKKNESIT